MQAVTVDSSLRPVGLQEEDFGDAEFRPLFNNPFNTGAVGKKGDCQGNIRPPFPALQDHTLDPNLSPPAFDSLQDPFGPPPLTIQQNDPVSPAEPAGAHVPVLLRIDCHQIADPDRIGMKKCGSP